MTSLTSTSIVRLEDVESMIGSICAWGGYTENPSAPPSSQPGTSFGPSAQPSILPSLQPSFLPSLQPTNSPTTSTTTLLSVSETEASESTTSPPTAEDTTTSNDADDSTEQEQSSSSGDNQMSSYLVMILGGIVLLCLMCLVGHWCYIYKLKNGPKHAKHGSIGRGYGSVELNPTPTKQTEQTENVTEELSELDTNLEKED